jgi:hypothetical protein
MSNSSPGFVWPLSRACACRAPSSTHEFGTAHARSSAEELDAERGIGALITGRADGCWRPRRDAVIVVRKLRLLPRRKCGTLPGGRGPVVVIVSAGPADVFRGGW